MQDATLNQPPVQRQPNYPISPPMLHYCHTVKKKKTQADVHEEAEIHEISLLLPLSSK